MFRCFALPINDQREAVSPSVSAVCASPGQAVADAPHAAGIDVAVFPNAKAHLVLNPRKDQVIGGCVIEVRVVKFMIDSPTEGKVVETLVTNWFDLPLLEFKHLYHLRWPAETNYSLLKNKLPLTDFTGFSVNSIIQEYWLAVLMSYLVGITFFEAQAAIDENASCDNTRKYQPNVNGIVGTIQRYIKDILFCKDKDTLADLGKCIVASAARDKVAKSAADRHFDRKTPRKARNHCNLKRNI